MLSYN